MPDYVVLLLSIGVPLAAALIVYLVGRSWDTAGSFLTTLASVATLGVILWLYSIVSTTGPVQLRIDVGLPFPVFLGADALGIYMGLISCLVWALASLYAMEYIEHRVTLFNVFLLLSLYGMLGIAFSGNLFTLLLFFELFSVASAVLVMHEGTPVAVRAAFQYLFMSVVGSVAVILASAAIYSITGSIDLLGAGIKGLAVNPWSTALFWLLVGGFAIKAGMFPVHVWLPEAHPIAPSPASALLSGVMIKAGAYGVIRVVYGVFGIKLVNLSFMSKTLLVLAVITMILGSVLAILQVELKRLLAYSSVAQIGYVMLGVSLLTEAGLQGGVLHVLAHALMKGSLFLAAGCVIHQTGKRNLADLDGLGKVMPWTMVAITLAAMSMIGIPPFIGFSSKWLLAVGALQAKGQGLLDPWAAYTVIGALVLSGLLNIVYYGPLLIRGWFSKPNALLNPDGHASVAHAFDGGEAVAGETDAESGSHVGHEGDGHGHHGEEPPVNYLRLEPSWMMLVPVVSLGVATLVFGVYVRMPMVLVENVVKLYF